MKKRNLILCVTLTIILITGGLFVYFYQQIQNLEAYRPTIVDYAKKVLARDIQYASGRVSFGFWPALTFDRVAIMEKNGRDPFASAARLTVRVALLPYLLERKIILKEINLQQPYIVIVRDKQGKWNIDDLIETKKEPPVEFGGLTVQEGAITFRDQWISPKGIQTDFKDVRFKIDHLQRGERTGFQLEAVLSENARRARLGMEGSLYLPRHPEPLINSRVDSRLRIQELDLDIPWPYYRGKVPFQQLAGLLNADIVVKGQKQDFTSSGAIELKNVKFQYPRVFPGPLAPTSFRLVYDLKRTSDEISLNKAELAVDDIRIKGQVAIRELGKEDPAIDIKATLGPFDLEKYGQYFPYGIIPPETSTFIKEHIRAGLFHIQESSLKGRLSQLRKWGAADHDNLLLVKTSVAKGVVGFGGSTPSFNGVTGELVFTERDIQFNKMTGYFGVSPVTLTGKIAGYPLPEPATYPFTATVQPTNRELAWLIGEDLFKKLSFSGNTTLKLSGVGPLANYRLNGEWSLTPARYQYGDVMIKPAGQENHLDFVAAIRDRKLQMDPFHYSLGSLVLSGTLMPPLKDANQPFSMSFRTNTVNLRDLQACFPELKRHQAEGLAQAVITGEGGGKAGTPDRWRGDISLQGTSFHLSENMKIIKEVNGLIHLEGDKTTSSGLSGRYGETPFTVAGTVAGFKPPDFSLTFSLPIFHPEDFGYRSLPTGYQIRDISGDVSFRNDLCQVRSLSARLNDAVVTARGSVQNGRERVIKGDVSFSYLKGEELAAVMKLEKTGDRKTSGPPISMQATVRAAAGKLGELSFSDLRADLDYDAKNAVSLPFLKATVRAATGKIDDLSFKNLHADLGYKSDNLEFTSLTWAMKDGRVAAKGFTKFPGASSPRHHYQFQIDRVPVESLLWTGEKDQRVKGIMTAKGDLSAAGKTAAELKASVTGTVNLGIEKGIIKNVNALYKIFSLLNMSQLLKFRLPDVNADGMPYNSITANLLLKNGIISSKDFYTDSDVMNILGMGSMDIVKESIDLKVGLQPLQTVDKIVSKIPVMGWILTDDDRRFITVYFAVKGPMKAPDVKAIPARELSAEGIDIVKRVFKLPQKLITDTGEVLY
ncbi:MAG: AsmA-like C-terminal domain-containing protein [Deltaproteobacteria bacterium]|nr:AsmA-like C-terminal domain-containing protein [Deltaproteobacteria bacterium]